MSNIPNFRICASVMLYIRSTLRKGAQSSLAVLIWPLKELLLCNSGLVRDKGLAVVKRWSRDAECRRQESG